MLKDLNKKLVHTLTSLDLEVNMNEEQRLGVLTNIFEVDDMFFFVRRFMKKFLTMLVKDFDSYIVNI